MAKFSKGAKVDLGTRLSPIFGLSMRLSVRVSEPLTLLGASVTCDSRQSHQKSEPQATQKLYHARSVRAAQATAKDNAIVP